MLLEVLSAGGDELDGGELISPLLKTRDDRTNKSTLDAYEDGDCQSAGSGTSKG